MDRESAIRILKAHQRSRCGRTISRLSEAAIKLGTAAEELCPDQPWPEIRGLGNHLPHGYDSPDPEVIWTTVTDDLPSLKRSCQGALRKLESAG